MIRTTPGRIASSAAVLALLAGCSSGDRGANRAGTSAGTTTAAATKGAACPGDNGGITLPDGFCATVFADSIGPARHVAVAPNGDVYVNTWSGAGGASEGTGPKAGVLVVLRDTTHDGKADVIQHFGRTGKRSGGTGIAIYKGMLYAEAGPQIVRYKLPANGLAPTGAPEVVVDGLPTTGDHPMHSIAIDSAGHMYVDLGSATNSCQLKNRTLESPGHQPCTELATRGGVWMYDANRTGQHFSPRERFATGIRNAVGLTIGPDGGPWSTQHGRDQLHDNWPKLYTQQQGEDLPAEEMLKLEKGADYGWPYCYFDGAQQKLLLAPEYGGDSTKVGLCASKVAPVAFFPAHWAPDGLVFYTATQFPARYRGGAFIAFHGSWNRAPGPQGGYNVVYQPMAGTKASGKYEIFADGFAGATKQPDRAAHRPAGLAVGPDGALYITDDKGGRIWRVTAR